MQEVLHDGRGAGVRCHLSGQAPHLNKMAPPEPFHMPSHKHAQCSVQTSLHESRCGGCERQFITKVNMEKA
ncbi:hypothetical protein E2C01_026132 [Portunus trituberculatus]|uniref:Uncharacterized protein n=1 Tax=Portunus trituberculatus TaxID=210409 RepID=A0A5B7EIC2_PORTR|nr:hypothetical protein [Portunus trituberculatus]